MDEVLRCLAGRDGVVDLWDLRGLALSHGGLVCPTVRRRAWTKLVGVDEHILNTATLTVPTLVSRVLGGGLSAFKEASSEASPEDAKGDGTDVASEDESKTQISAEDFRVVELSQVDLDMMKRDAGRSVWYVSIVP